MPRSKPKRSPGKAAGTETGNPASNAEGRRKRGTGLTFSLPPTVSKPELLDQDGRSDRSFRQFLYDILCWPLTWNPPVLISRRTWAFHLLNTTL